ncbi:uncharacterized protein T551_03240 [Pneumocystis jirovecii RU7]|uniref:Uncharacterized protein n=1 Tax=Pneumocystis jirovecii (strain RU7) TaxID=1408657 RepID=A0A0W4ZFU5_PNEJ7|nr:uncharacterized protein T551_03240 [Pneumocystis jirovecii RU7]KTW27246.1 hypothetical protein T551_03240 [Pneumocystis jirovecii RU7]
MSLNASMTQEMDLLTAALRENDEWSDESVEQLYPYSLNIPIVESKKDKRRRLLIEKLDHISRDFLINRESYFHNQLLSLQNEIQQLHDGTHIEYLDGLRDLEEIREKELKSVQLMKEFLLKRAENEFVHNVEELEEEFAISKTTLKSTLLSHLFSRKRRLHEDKELLDIVNDSSLASHSYSTTNPSLSPISSISNIDKRKLRHRKGLGNNKNTSIDDSMPPSSNVNNYKKSSDNISSFLKSIEEQIAKERSREKQEKERDRASLNDIFSLKESEIMEDLAAIKRQVNSTKPDRKRMI